MLTPHPLCLRSFCFPFNSCCPAWRREDLKQRASWEFLGPRPELRYEPFSFVWKCQGDQEAFSEASVWIPWVLIPFPAQPATSTAGKYQCVLGLSGPFCLHVTSPQCSTIKFPFHLPIKARDKFYLFHRAWNRSWKGISTVACSAGMRFTRTTCRGCWRDSSESCQPLCSLQSTCLPLLLFRVSACPACLAPGWLCKALGSPVRCVGSLWIWRGHSTAEGCSHCAWLNVALSWALQLPVTWTCKVPAIN